MVNVAAVLGSTVTHAVAQISIPDDAFLVGFDVSAYQSNVVIAYAYKL